MTKTTCLARLVFALALAAVTSHASSITPGNLVIYRVGDGSAALGTAATAVFLDEYTPLGTLVQSIALPTTGVSALTAVGNATTEGVISRSQDGTSLIFTGYRKDAGLANPSADTALVTGRVIGTLPVSGLFNTTIALTDAGGNGTIRSATSVDGASTFYTSASSGFVRYIGTPSGSSTSVLIDGRNSRQLNLSGNTLWAANGSTAIAAKVQTYGTLPTGATTPTPVVTLGTGDAVNGFALFDLSPGVPGVDTVYALSTVASQLIKWTFDGTSWAASGSLASTAQNLTGYADASGVRLFLTTAGTLSTELDTSGYAGTLTGTITPLATAGANTAFRGIGMFEVIPEPSTAGLALLGAVSLFLVRRRRD
jgi:hypothetical protein